MGLVFALFSGACLLVVGYMVLVLYLKITRKGCTSRADLTGKVVVITGANTGIGYEAALDLARRNTRVILACRNKDRGEWAASRIRDQTGNDNVVCQICDVSSMKSVREFVKMFKTEETRLDILINNAGVSGVPLSLTEDGLDLAWASNYLGHFLLTYLLLDVLKDSTPSRIVNVSSFTHAQGKLDFEDLFSSKKYVPGKVYNDTKLAQVVYNKELATRLQGTGVMTFSLNPGVVQTEVMRHYPILGKIFHTLAKTGILKTPREGAQTTIHCAVSDEVLNDIGRYFDNCQVAKESPLVENAALRRQLWSVSEHLVGITS